MEVLYVIISGNGRYIWAGKPMYIPHISIYNVVEKVSSGRDLWGNPLKSRPLEIMLHAKLIMANFMVEELRREREASALSLPKLTEFFDGGEYPSEIWKKACIED